MKKHFAFSKILLLIGVVFFGCSEPAVDSLTNDDTIQAGNAGFSHADMRIESEDKLTVPIVRTEEVWDFLRESFVENPDRLQAIDASLEATYSEELFVDTYFDTPDLKLHAMQSGVRHRRRTNVSDPNDNKSGKELMQVKINNISSNALHRGEIKFGIDYPHKFKSMDDKHPAIGIVKRSKRDEFKETVAKLGLNAQDLQPVVTNEQRRRRIYINHNNSPFMSISLDEVSSEVLWARIRFTELEPELNEIAYTDADEYTRAYMDKIGSKITEAIRAQFPDIQRDLTPKYNKVVNAFEQKIPFFRFLVRHQLI